MGNLLFTGWHYYEDELPHFVGETITATIAFLSWPHFRDQVSVGDRFAISEGPRVIGHGVVDEILPVTATPTPETGPAEVVLESPGDKLIYVIKEVRALTGLDLREAKDLVESTPKVVLSNVTQEAAQRAKEQLEAAGAIVSIR